MSNKNGSQNKVSSPPDLFALSQFLAGIADLPLIIQGLKSQSEEFQKLRQEISELLRCSRPSSVEGWMDAKRAAAYLGVSAGTFDKFRYLTQPKLKGYKAGGKTYYQRADLDNFIKLYDVRSQGLG